MTSKTRATATWMFATATLLMCMTQPARSQTKGCDLTPRSPLEIKRLLSVATADRAPETVCLAGLSKDLADTLEVTKMLSGFQADSATKEKAAKFERNGEMGGWFEFPLDRMREPMLEAIAKAGSVDLRALGVKTRKFIEVKQRAIAALKTAADVNAEEREARIEALNAQLDAATVQLHESAVASSWSWVNAFPWRTLDMQKDLVALGSWRPGTEHTSTAASVGSRTRVTGLASFHTHPPGNSFFHSLGDLTQLGVESGHPFYIGQFVHLEDDGRMSWSAPSGLLLEAEKKRPDVKDFNQARLSLCTSLHSAQLSTVKSKPASFDAASRECIAWASEMNGHVLYEGDREGRFSRVRRTGAIPIVYLLSSNLPPVRGATPRYHPNFLRIVLSYLAFNEGYFRPDEGPATVSQSRRDEILREWWQSDGMGALEPGPISLERMEQLLLAVADRQTADQYNYRWLVVCREGTDWPSPLLSKSPVTRPCVKFSYSAWTDLDYSGTGVLTMVFGDFALRYDTETNLNYPRIEREDFAVALAMADGRVLGESNRPPRPPADLSFELEDWGIPVQSELRKEEFHWPTPTSIPGAHVVRTPALKAMLDSKDPPLVIDVLSSEWRRTLPGALQLPDAGMFATEKSHGAGAASFNEAVRKRLAIVLAKETAGNKDKAVVFLCLSPECWLSYNAALRAVAEGYRKVYWYRGGTAAWRNAGLPWTFPQRIKFADR